MNLQDFSLTILRLPSKYPAEEDRIGYVALNHGEQYGICVSNHNFLRRAVLTVTVNTTEVGRWIMPAGSREVIEHPIGDPACFHFYNVGTAESNKLGTTSGDASNGLVSAAFVFEKLQESLSFSLYRGSGAKSPEGTTGLAGHSDQKWEKFTGQFMPADEVVTITLRLVGKSASSNLHALGTVTSNPVPPKVV